MLVFDTQPIFDDLITSDRKSLFSKYKACNNQTFVDGLREQGATMVQVESVFYAMMLRMLVVGIDPPKDCLLGPWESVSLDAIQATPDMA